MSRQMYLFGDVGVKTPDREPASLEIRMLTWNLQAPSIERARKQVAWLAGVKADVLILTEATYSEGSLHVISEIESLGFSVFFAEPKEGKYSTAICTTGFKTREDTGPESSSFPRARAVHLETFLGDLHVMGLYGPSSWGDLPSDKVEQRKAFHHQVLEWVRAKGRTPNLIIGGDLNVVEPNHRPRVPGFEDHSFYSGLLRLGMTDAYRIKHPEVQEYSWYSQLMVGLRLDHFLVSSALVTLVGNCEYDHGPRTAKLSDHSAMLLSIRKPG